MKLSSSVEVVQVEVAAVLLWLLLLMLSSLLLPSLQHLAGSSTRWRERKTTTEAGRRQEGVFRCRCRCCLPHRRPLLHFLLLRAQDLGRARCCFRARARRPARHHPCRGRAPTRRRGQARRASAPKGPQMVLLPPRLAAAAGSLHQATPPTTTKKLLPLPRSCRCCCCCSSRCSSSPASTAWTGAWLRPRGREGERQRRGKRKALLALEIEKKRDA